MKVKLICRDEAYKKAKVMFEENGYQIDDEYDFLYLERDHQQSKLVCQDYNGCKVICSIDEIKLIESDSYKNRVILKDGDVLLTNENLSYFESEVFLMKLIRVNKSQIVGVSSIRKLSPQLNSRVKLTLNDNTKIFVTRTYVKKFREMLHKKGELKW